MKMNAKEEPKTQNKLLVFSLLLKMEKGHSKSSKQLDQKRNFLATEMHVLYIVLISITCIK